MGKKAKQEAAPKPRDLVSRPRLLAALDAALGFPTTIVCAPAGFGKTVLARQWAQRADAAVALVDARGSETVAACLQAGFSALVAGRGASDAVVVENVPAGVADVPSCLEAAARAARCADCAVVVIDDVAAQAASGDARFNDAYRILSNLPGSVHVVMLSRGCVDAGASRLRLEGKLLDVSAEQLRFTELETREALHAGALDRESVQRIYKASRGWPAGVRMASFALADHPDAASAAFRAAWHAMVGRYAAETVLPGLPADVALLVESLSYIGCFSEELACSVMQWDAARTSAAVAQAMRVGAPLFEEPPAGAKRVFAVHPLIAESLSARTGSLGAGKDVAIRRACDWCEQRGLADRAVALAGSVGDWDRIAAVIARRWRTMFAQSRSADLLEWFSLLPREYVLSRPKLAAVEVLPLAVFGRQLEVYENLRRAKPDERRSQPDELTYLYWSVRCVALASIGDVEQAVSAGEHALSVLPDDEEYLRAMVAQSLGGASALADPVGACRMFQDALPLVLRQGMRNPLCSAYANAARLYAHIGCGEEALDAARRAKAIAAEVPSMQAMYAQAVLAKAQVFYDRNDLDGCRVALAWLADAARHTRIPEHTAQALATSALLSHHAGDEEAAGDAASSASLLSPAGVVRSFAPLDALRSWADAGAFSAQASLTELEGVARQSPYAQVMVLSAHYVLGDVDLDGANRALALADAVAAAPRYRIRALVLAALLLERAGDEHAAEDALNQAFCAAEPYNLVRTFLDEADLAPIWRRASRAAGANAWSAELYRRNVGSVSRRPQPQAAVLTERELDVMRLAAQGLTVQGVADELFVSRETVKKHLANVYQKLDVHTKLQAVSLLQERGVL